MRDAEIAEAEPVVPALLGTSGFTFKDKEMLEKLSPIMPARNLAKAQEFYAALGFLTIYLDDEYLLMKREGAEISFFPASGARPLYELLWRLFAP